jgi:predicted site-specific integrase-resolvase
LADIKRITPRELNQLDERITLNYARVSSHDQKEDLKRQAQVLEAFSAANGWQYETIQDLGSGLNYHKKGLQKLLKRIMQGDVPRLVLTPKDRRYQKLGSKHSRKSNNHQGLRKRDVLRVSPLMVL